MADAARWLTERHAESGTACSRFCGAFLLAETGLIDGRRVTTHWALRRRAPQAFSPRSCWRTSAWCWTAATS